MSDVFKRLVGLETEYALRFHPGDSTTPIPSKFRMFRGIVAALKRRLPTANAPNSLGGVFTANGGAVWFEGSRPAAGGGLVEGATPECRGPRQALIYQLAQDRILSECARSSRPGLSLIKNDRDACDNVYGAQENYEVNFASGWRLALWRCGLVLLFPLALVTWLSIVGCFLVTLVYFLGAALFYLAFRKVFGPNPQIVLGLFGRDISEGQDTLVHLPLWLETTIHVINSLVTAPLAILLFLLLRISAFAQVHPRLLPFLVSRTVLVGAGMVNARGEFKVADKAPSINCVFGFGGIIRDRPIYSLGHFYKAIQADSWFSPREYAGLFAPRQRLQIAIGDSNMCETAQFLRIGTTLLVLDAIDAGFFGYYPRLASPLRALRAIADDPTLGVRVPVIDEECATALQIQRFYYSACRAFVGSLSDPPDEARQVLELWQQTLEDLEQLAREPSATSALVGSLDWVTKKYLLDHAGAEATWAERKKIDLRYHELSSEGYFERLRGAGLIHSLVDDQQLERAMRIPPPNSPATTRGHYIREFATLDESLSVNWKVVVIGRGRSARVIRLADYGKEIVAPPRVPPWRRNRNLGRDGRPNKH